MAGMLQLAEGAIFAREYKVIRPLNRGGMGAVYVVEHLGTGRPRALKVMHADLVADPKQRQRFELEARVGSKIESNHVVEVIDAGVDPQTGTPFLTMELLQGVDLADHMQQRGALAPSAVKAIFEQLCHALGAAHAAGIVHRDLKPQNVFLAASRQVGAPFIVKVLDFGIAKLTAEVMSQETQAMGSPSWMSPEQTTPGQAITPSSDVWALGLLAFHALTGRYYWRSVNSASSTITMLIREIVLDPIPPASLRAREVGAPVALGPDFDAWFARCVAREPHLRFPDARACFAALAPVLDRMSGALPSGPTLPTGPVAAIAPPMAQLPTVHRSGAVAAPWPTASALTPQPSAPPKSRGGGSALLWILVGAVSGFVILFLLFFLLVLSAATSKTPPAPSSAPPRSTVVPDDEPAR